jgi:hypothetical protein
LVDSSFMAPLCQRIASLPTVSRLILIPRPLLLCPALLCMNCCLPQQLRPTPICCWRVAA